MLYTTAPTSVIIIAQKPMGLNAHAFGKSRVKKTAIPITNTNSPESISILMLAVLENSLLGVRVAMLILLSFRYIKMYQTAPIIKYTTRYIFR